MTQEAEPDDLEEPPQSWFSAVAALLVIIGAVAYLTTFDFLAAGDGAVGVDSESLPVAFAEDSANPVSYVARDPEGAFTIGFPLRNRGLFVGATVTGIERPPLPSSEIPAECVWRRTAVSGRREQAVSQPGTSQTFGSASVAAGANVQLYLGGGFADGECPTDPGTYDTVESMVVEYRLLGVLPRRQLIPLTVAVTTAFDPDDPALDTAED